jgi:hypothetical protein
MPLLKLGGDLSRRVLFAFKTVMQTGRKLCTLVCDPAATLILMTSIILYRAHYRRCPPR